VKILLDECLPVDFRHAFSNHDAHTLQWAGFKSRKNGELLVAAELAGYEVLITVNQGVPQHQSVNRKISIVLLRSRTNQLEDLLPLVGATLDVLMTLEPGQVVLIGK
jgi:predicted nuclease of predicted toxin-antitoxin system